MKKLMEKLRNNPPKSFAGIKSVSMLDYLDSTVKSIKEKIEIDKIDLPSSNVLQFILEDGSKLTVRPSGTEPKIKFYISCCDDPTDKLEIAKDEVAGKVAGIKSDILKIIDEVK
jgi:phosphoglucomutase